MTLEELKVIITAQTQELNKSIEGVKSQLKGLDATVTKTNNKISSSFKGLARTIAALGIGKIIKDSFTEAVKVDANIENINRNLQDSAQMYLKWAETNAKAFGISKAEAIKYGSVFSGMVSNFSKDTKTASTLTIQLMQASAIIASKTGRSMSDVLERIRSGMLGNTEAIEDLGIYVNASVIQQTRAYQMLSNGVPWEKLNFYTRQQIISLAILEQASARFGNTISSGLTGQLLILRASLANLSLAFGQAFIPIATIVIPYLIKLIQHLQVALTYVVAFMRVLFGVGHSAQKSMNDIQKNLTNIIKPSGGGFKNSVEKPLTTGAKKAKEIKNALLGFDEINKLDLGKDTNVDAIPTPTPTGGADIGAISDFNVGTLSDAVNSFNVSLDESQKKVENVLEKLKKWLPVIAAIGAAILSYFTITRFDKIAFTIADIIYKIRHTILYNSKTFVISRPRAKIVDALVSIEQFFLDLIFVATRKIALIVVAIALVVGAIIYLWKTNEGFRNAVIETWNNIKGLVSSVWEGTLKPIFTAFAKTMLFVWEYGIKPLWDAFANFVGELIKLALKIINVAIIPVLKFVTDNILPVIAPIIQLLIMAIGAAVVTIAQLLTALLKIINKIIAGITATINPLITLIKSVFVGAFTTAVSLIIGIFDTLKTSIIGIIDALKKIFNGLITFITGVFTANWRQAFQGLSSIVSGIFSGLYTIVKTPINLIIDGVNALIKGLNKIKLEMPSWVPGVGGKTFGINIPIIPKLARGGIVDSATIFMAGERGREVVMPLENNTGWIAEVANKIVGYLPPPQTSSAPIEVTLELNGTKLGRVVIDSINKLQKQEGRVLLQL